MGAFIPDHRLEQTMAMAPGQLLPTHVCGTAQEVPHWWAKIVISRSECSAPNMSSMVNFPMEVSVREVSHFSSSSPPATTKPEYINSHETQEKRSHSHFGSREIYGRKVWAAYLESNDSHIRRYCSGCP